MFIFIFTVAAVNLLIGVAAPSALSSLVSTIAWFALVVCMFRRSPVTTSITLPVVVPHLAAQISLNFIEMGSYMPELGREGLPSSAAQSYALYNMLLLLAGFRVIEALRPRAGGTAGQDVINSWKEITAACALAANGLALLYLAQAGLRTGFPTLMGMDRFFFRMNYADVIVSNILNLKFVLSAMLGVAFAASDAKIIRSLSLLTCAASIMIWFLYGDKFFTIICYFSFFLSPLCASRPKEAMRFLASLVPVGGIVVIAAFAVTLFIYSDYGSTDLSVAMVRLGERISGQGQLWYAYVYDEARFFAWNSRDLLLNIESIFAKNGAQFVFENRLATFYFVDRYATFQLIASMDRNEGAITLTMAYEAYAAALTGYAGLVPIMLLTGVLMGLIGVWFVRVAGRGDALAISAPAYVLTQFWFMTNQATVSSMLSLGTLKSFIVFFVVGLGSRQASRFLFPRSRPASGLSSRRWLPDGIRRFEPLTTSSVTGPEAGNSPGSRALTTPLWAEKGQKL